MSRAETPTADEGPKTPRVLFLDDDPGRAEVFLARYPHAVWVQTTAECIEKLAENWDEVHLDHDLGGEHFVDIAREDCGMEVVRWLCLSNQPHLRKTRFVVHSHNPNAATMMSVQMMVNGYTVEQRPFGSSTAVKPGSTTEPEDDDSVYLTPTRPAPVLGVFRKLLRYLRGAPPTFDARAFAERLRESSAPRPDLGVPASPDEGPGHTP